MSRPNKTLDSWILKSLKWSLYASLFGMVAVIFSGNDTSIMGRISMMLIFSPILLLGMLFSLTGLGYIAVMVGVFSIG